MSDNEDWLLNVLGAKVIDLDRAAMLLREALKSDHLTLYVESRIRSALIALGKSP